MVWLKGKPIPEETKRKISKSLKGHPPTFCKPHSEETKRKLSMKLKGRRLSKGNLGKKLSKEWIKNISQGHKGIGHTEETKRKLSKIVHRYFQTHPAHKGMLGKKQTEEAKIKMRKARLLQKFKTKETNIERKIEQELQKRNLYYQKHIPLCNVTIVDFYLPQTRTVIYCDGDYWHSLEGRKDKDINQDVILTFNGFNVYRFTESQINKSPKRCINKISERQEFPE